MGGESRCSGGAAIQNVLSFLSGGLLNELQYSGGHAAIDSALSFLEREGIADPNEVPLGLLAIFLILLSVGVINLFAKPVATIGGVGFSVVFFVLFIFSERPVGRRRRSKSAR